MKDQLKIITSSLVQAFNIFVQKSASKKFVVWAVATHMAYIGLLGPQSWLAISMIYMGIEGGLDYKNLPALIASAGSPTKTKRDQQSDFAMQPMPAEPEPIQPRPIGFGPGFDQR